MKNYKAQSKIIKKNNNEHSTTKNNIHKVKSLINRFKRSSDTIDHRISKLKTKKKECKT